MTAFERRVAGDALQLAGLVRDHGPETLHRLMDLWGPDHTRAVCIALAAAVDQDRTPTELWGWLGPVDNVTRVSVRSDALFKNSTADFHAEIDKAAVDLRPVDPKTKQGREYRRRKLTGKRGAA